MKRNKLVLSLSQAHHALGLADDVHIVGFHATVDPAQLHILLEADWFNAAPEDSEAPRVCLAYVRSPEDYK